MRRNRQLARHSEPGPSYLKIPVSFSNRTQAAQMLVGMLEPYRGTNPLVLAIPRGSVPMAKIIAEKLCGDLDVVLVHKIGAPDNPEFAVGSVSEFGSIYRTEAGEFYGIQSEYIENLARIEIERLKQKRRAYSLARPPISPKGRIVILVDDGIATGSTMVAAIRAIRSQSPEEIVVASPVAAVRVLEVIKNEVQNVAVLETPEEFFSISQFYDDFPQVTDEKVLEILASHSRGRAA